MENFHSYTKNVFQFAIITIIFLIILWFILPYKAFLQSYILGTLTSILNGWITKRKTLQITESPSRKKNAGTLPRMALAAFAIYLTLKFPDWFSLAPVLIGLFTIQILSVAYALIIK